MLFVVYYVVLFNPYLILLKQNIFVIRKQYNVWLEQHVKQEYYFNLKHHVILL